MRKIIAGIKYDTETATEWGRKTQGKEGTVSFTEEILYQKDSGEFFLYGRGGGGTKYADLNEEQWWEGGEKIIPMNYDDAKTWAVENLEVKDYEKAFGKAKE